MSFWHKCTNYVYITILYIWRMYVDFCNWLYIKIVRFHSTFATRNHLETVHRCRDTKTRGHASCSSCNHLGVLGLCPADRLVQQGRSRACNFHTVRPVGLVNVRMIARRRIQRDDCNEGRRGTERNRRRRRRRSAVGHCLSSNEGIWMRFQSCSYAYRPFRARAT